MRWNALVVLWLCTSAAALGCSASSSAGRYSMSPPAMQQSMGPSAPVTVSTTSSVEEGGSTSVEADEAPSRPSPPGVAANQPAREPASPAQPAPRNLPGITRATGPAGNTGGTTPPTQPAQPTPAAPAPMLVYTAEIELQTNREQVVATLDRIIEAATAMGGYLLRRTDNSVQVRVPSARFRDSLRRVEDFGEVMHRSVAAQDVSEEYRDLEVRLQNLRAVRRRLEEFLSRAGSMADALSVERELERVTREIDTIEGRLRFLSTRVSFSLVTVNVTARPEGAIASGPAMPPRRAIDLPVEWFRRLGLERLLNTSE